MKTCMIRILLPFLYPNTESAYGVHGFLLNIYLSCLFTKVHYRFCDFPLGSLTSERGIESTQVKTAKIDYVIIIICGEKCAMNTHSLQLSH